MKLNVAILVSILQLLVIEVSAQLLSARMGLSESGKSNLSVLEQSIRSLDNVQNVQFEHSSKAIKITFKPNSETSLYALSEKVRSAGFTIWSTEAVVNFNKTEIRDNESYSFQTFELRFVHVGKKKVAGEQTIIFVGKEFLNKAQYRKWKPLVNEDKKIAGSAKDIYYVTL